MSENISPELAYEQFYFAGERCECCGKQISRNNRGREGRGAWEAHHRFPDRDVTFDNIRGKHSTIQVLHITLADRIGYEGHNFIP